MSSSACSWRCLTWPWPGLMITSPWALAAPGIVTGDTNHFIVPHSKLNVSVCAGLMCVTVMPGSSCTGSAKRQVGEGAHLGGERAFGGQPLHRRRAEEAADPGGACEHVPGVGRLGDRAAVT